MKNQIVAIPLEGGILCSHFGHCEHFAILEIKDGAIISEKLVTPPAHEPGLYPAWIAEMGVTDVIAGGMGQKAIELFNQQKINAFVGAPSKPAKQLVSDFIANKLNLTANYCNHDENGTCTH